MELRPRGLLGQVVRPQQIVNVQRRIWEYNRRRRVVEIRATPLPGFQGYANELADRISAIVMLAEDEYRQILIDQPGQWRASVVLQSLDREELLQHPGMGTHRAFNSVQDIRDNLGEAIFLALENFSQSNQEHDIEEFVFQVRFDRVEGNRANGKMKAYIKRAIQDPENVGGLYLYNGDGLCGYKAVVYALVVDPEIRANWTGSLEWLYSAFVRRELNVRALQAVGRFHGLARALKNELGFDDDQWTIMPYAGVETTAALFVQKQPKFQIIVFNQISRQLMDRRAGTEYNDMEPKKATLLMSFTLNHLQLIRSMRCYYGKVKMPRIEFCYRCLQLAGTGWHECKMAAGKQCPACLVFLASEQALTNHKRGESVECAACDKTFFNETCFDTHRCRRCEFPRCEEGCGRVLMRGVPHDCAEYSCASCRVNVRRGHLCPMFTPDYPQELQTAEEAGKNMYAFDFESLLLNQGNEVYLHQVNLVVVRRCFSEQEWVFQNLEEFVTWVELLQEPSSFYAHNFKGYDGRLLYEFLIDKRTAPNYILWTGAKIMEMHYGAHKFRDTLPHLTTSLAQLPKMMGLDETEFKKGFFPYLFNIPENQQYRGPIPDRRYFGYDTMALKKQREFDEWYPRQIGEYDFAKELLEYCQSDTRILAKSMERYMAQMMERVPYNPWDKLTSASYAMTVYLLFFNPPNSLYRLSKRADSEIRPSMHGGRTDTRCLLKEWSEEELAAGKFGRYQDVQSLYPTVQFYDPMPVGTARLKNFENCGVNQPTDAELYEMFGFVCCDIECPQDLFHPVIVHTCPETKRLIADLKPKRRIVVPTPELHLAMRMGYKITWVHYWHAFDKSYDLFKEYFQTFLCDKLEASGVPDWVQTPEQWLEFEDYHREQLGIDLKRERMIKNPTRKTGAKILCNSLWGKFGERMHRDSNHQFMLGEDDEKILALETQWIDGLIDINYRRMNSAKTQVTMNVKYNGEPPAYRVTAHLGKTNIAIASMVTSHARVRLWTEMHKLGERVLYHDTDSIIYEYDPAQYNIPIGRYLGEWEDECGGLPITKFVSTGPKCYSYGVQQPDGTVKYTTKAKGITLHAQNSGLINYDSMKQLVTGDIDSIVTQCLLFQYDLQRGTMVTRNVLKLFQKSLAKGRVDPQTLKVYPFV